MSTAKGKTVKRTISAEELAKMNLVLDGLIKADKSEAAANDWNS